MDRRSFLRTTALAAAAGGLGPSFWRAAIAAPTGTGTGPYGPVTASNLPDVLLPEGFSARVVAVAGRPVEGTDFVWPPFPDGKAVYPTGDGGWVVACNSEVPGSERLRDELGLPAEITSGGASSIRFDGSGNIVAAYPILTGTDGNCAGGATPWNTWLSCEEPQIARTHEHVQGAVFECDPYQPGQGRILPAMGLFKHEGVAIDPVNGHAFLTEDESDGTFYRFIPDDYASNDLSSGTLQVPIVAADGAVTWHDVPDPLADEVRTADQVPGTTRFDGGEGIWYDRDPETGNGYVYFTTKNDHRVWVHDITNQTITVLYEYSGPDDALGPKNPGDTSVDNLTVAPSGDLYVAEDGGNLEVVLISADTRDVVPFVRFVGDHHGGSEICGPAFSPDGSRLYVSSQRASALPVGIVDPTNEVPLYGNGFGVTYEITGPFRTDRVGIAALDGDGKTTKI